MIEILTRCPICGGYNSVKVEFEDYLRWVDGEGTYECFPYLSADERELLITGVCSSCWNEMCDDMEDEEDELDEEEI